MKKSGVAIEYVPEKYITEEMCKNAVKNMDFGFCFQHIPEKFLTGEICMNAVKKKHSVIRHISEKFLSKKICQLAFDGSYTNIIYIPQKYMTKKMCETIISQKKVYIDYLPKEYLLKYNDSNTKKKKEKIPQKMRMMVWDKYIGLDIGKSKCKCCNEKEISQMDFECGHIIAEANGGKMTIDNLLPICGPCNRSMKTTDLFVFQKKLEIFKNK